MICLFNKKSVGIDIADHRIWVTRMVKSGGVSVIDSVGGVKLEQGVVVNGRIKNKKVLAKAINSLMDKIKAETACEKRIVFGLPKNQSFVHVFSDTTGNRRKDYIDRIVKEDTENSIPIEADDLYYTYKILSKEGNKTKFLVVAVSRKMIQEWQDFFASVGVDVQVYDLGSLATYRNLYKKPPKKPLCMIDIGGDSTSITVFNNKGLRYSHSIKTAGISFSKKIAKELDISLEEAEKLKKKTGIVLRGKIFSPLEKAFKPIIKTTEEIFHYIKIKTGEDIDRVVLVGGSAQLKGVSKYLESKLKVPVELGRPIISKGRSDFEYLNSIGLALRGLERRSKQKDPGLSALKKQKKTKEKIISEDIEETEEEKGAIAMDLSESEDEKKVRKQKRLLIVILLIGVVLIGLSFVYRSKQRSEKQDVQNGMLNFNVKENVFLEIPVAVIKEEYAIDRVKGRITESIENKLKNSEKVWIDPVLRNPNRWLIYSETEVKTLLLAKIKNDIVSDFSLDKMEVTGVASTDNRNIFMLMTNVSIYVSEALEKEEAQEPVKMEEFEEEIIEEEKEEIIKEVDLAEISDTPTGWLNVRSGPGTNNSIITRVDSGEKYEIVTDEEEWLEIKLDDTQNGWVYKQYINYIK